MNIANKLTLSRIVLIIPFIYFLEYSKIDLNYRIIALLIFIAASLTDYFDGYLARKHNLISDFGKLMDPLADKILVISSLIIFVKHNYIWSCLVIIIIAREFLVTGVRTIAASKGEVIPAGNLGKWKTVSQMLVIGTIILIGEYEYNNYFMLVPTILTVVSGLEYIKNGSKYFK